MKRLCVIFSFILIALAVNGLWAQDTAVSRQAGIRLKSSGITYPYLSPQRLHTSLTFGTGYMASKYGGGFFTSFSPGITYKLTPKFSLEAGVQFSTGFTALNPLMHIEPGPAQMNRTSHYSIYASGHYMLSNRLVLTGTAYKTINPNHTPQINPFYLDYKGGSLGLDYMLNEHVRISTTIGFSNYGRSGNPLQNGLTPQPLIWFWLVILFPYFFQIQLYALLGALPQSLNIYWHPVSFKAFLILPILAGKNCLFLPILKFYITVNEYFLSLCTAGSMKRDAYVYVKHSIILLR